MGGRGRHRRQYAPSEIRVTVMAGSPRLEFRDVSKRFANPRPNSRQGGGVVVAVEGVSLSIADGEVVSLIGPSGCGKSTLLNMGAGLDPVSSGQVWVDGELVTRPNRHVAFMLQKDLLLPWRTIVENVELGQEIQAVPARERRQRALDLLAKCRLSDFVDHYPHQLSGGMRQRAALARTLAVDPSVLLMDEPFSALDAQTKMVLQQDLGRTLADTAKTALFITHDLVEAVALSDRVLVMSQRPGRIIEEIVVGVGDRDNPMKRRQHPRIAEYVVRLMGLLQIEQAAA
jgi:NitT/TauT family transport system ATP-binding protein